MLEVSGQTEAAAADLNRNRPLTFACPTVGVNSVVAARNTEAAAGQGFSLVLSTAFRGAHSQPAAHNSAGNQ